MKTVPPLATALLICCLVTSSSADDPFNPDLTVNAPLTRVEMTCAAKLTRLRTIHVWWNDDNRIVGVSLKGVDANNRAVALCARLAGLESLVLVALPHNQLDNTALVPLVGHQQLRLLSISGDRLTDQSLEPLRHLPKLERLMLNGNFTDNALRQVGQITNLTYLDLTQCPVTDLGIAQLGQLAELQSLVLNGTRVSNEALASIAEFKRLTELYLGDTAVDESGIEQLQRMQQLQTLFLKGTGFTPASIARLVAGMPTECQVIHDDGTSRGQRTPRTAFGGEPSASWRAAR